MSRHDKQILKDALTKVRAGTGQSTVDPVDRLFAASRRWLRGCQTQYDAVRGIYDEIKEGKYTTDRIVPDTLALYGGLLEEIVGTWETLYTGAGAETVEEDEVEHG